ncbi:MAG: two-component system sensor histidine kinase NtrB [Thermodesulfobacteriota bacterium]
MTGERSRAQSLRDRAEQIVKQSSKQIEEISTREIRNLLHELSVHQIEMELQNEELRDAHRKLEKARHRLSVLFDHAPVGYLLIDSVGSIRMANHTFAEMVEEAVTMLPNHPFSLWLHPKDRNIFLSRFKAFFKHPEGKHIELRLRTRRGKDFHARLEGRSDPMPGPGEDSSSGERLLLIVSDISKLVAQEKERLTLERRVQQSKKRESLGTMAGGIAHHFNNLLFAVLGNLDLAKEHLPAGFSSNHLLEAEKAAQRASDLSRVMLTYIGQGFRRKETLDLIRYVQELLPGIREELPDQARLEVDLPKEIPPVNMDPLEVGQVIRHLVTNAWEALENQEGVVRISVGATDPGDSRSGRNYAETSLAAGTWVRLEVTDTGVGMDRDTRSRIFDPFFTTKFTGRGLGLPVTVGIVRAYGGAVFVQSRPGRGTTVRVLFPSGSAKTDT